MNGEEEIEPAREVQLIAIPEVVVEVLVNGKVRRGEGVDLQRTVRVS